ncbi:MAG: hypothetical protein WCT51_00495 [Candidatus Shapirobacteria bacterium]
MTKLTNFGVSLIFLVFWAFFLWPFLQSRCSLMFWRLINTFNHSENVNRKIIELLDKKRYGFNITEEASKKNKIELYKMLMKINLSNPNSCNKCFYEKTCDKRGYCREGELINRRNNIRIELEN